MAVYADLKDKRVLVTGAAGGIGQAQVKAFLKQGAKVIGVDRRESQLTDALLTSVKLDLSDHDALVAFMQQCEVDIVCNTAGVLDDFKPIGETSEADFADILQTNLNAVFTITKHLIQQNRPTRVC
ncbi:SDR family NAD(P)-dependent oxidoreductase [Latilactobacillus fuchuensis]|uniref:Uncharacterized protein n=1 Tax=Latilactobacillus fuchuensis DSM 14340 = JCM 11249 TaxID=1423747 RepID=A0A0R1RXF3_9LACO|nr:SDR family NAD(P)-dependent oxidoreductase [Latilactobacillus fuchuensis]KRL59098.1 hypothetical protein FC69_GL001857 [Latilactobacillus fuchuensis DSM 14340 = JCM 11249]